MINNSPRIYLVIIFLFLFCFKIDAQNVSKQITLEDLFTKRTFTERTIDGLRSMSDGEHYSRFNDNYDLILKCSYKTGKIVDTICKLSETRLNEVFDYKFNSDESKILFETNRKAIYRHSYSAEYYVWDLKSKNIKQISDKKVQQIADFSPDGSKVAFVFENNLYYSNLETGIEVQITNDGAKNQIINGIPDWVYEEEFSFNKAFEWSPDSEKIAFIRFDETRVRTFDMTVYAGLAPKLKSNILYPENRQWKYPKAGEDNSIVSVHIYNLQSGKTINADIGKETDIYVPRIKWTRDANLLSIVRLNRLQNKFELLLANAGNGLAEVIYTDQNKYYIDETIGDNLSFLPENQFVITSERDGYMHIYLYKNDGFLLKQITKGSWDVTECMGYDEKNKVFYYQSAEESPIKRSVYSIDQKGNKTKLSLLEGTNSAEFSSGFKYYINYFSSATCPNYVTLHNAKGKLIRILEDNTTLKGKVKDYGGINKSFLSFKTTEGIDLNAYIIKPSNFDASKKYPVIVTQYSGPNSQKVVDSWSFGYNEMLAQKGYIVACVDPRGTGARGEAFRKVTYKELGKYETIDLIEFAKYLKTLAFVDASRIGIWGWSYGGYMTLLCMTKGADHFKTGIAVAPVTNWRYYDNIYTERYMQKPQDNASGYDNNSPINYADKLKGKLMLIHGTADDNVHVQNSMEMSEALVQANKQFEQFYYTNRNHGIRGGNTSLHLYKMMIDYLEKNL
jgi:dipeptidyl-peptidase-4